MSIANIIDTGICPPSWVRLRAHRLHSCTDIQFDGELLGRVRLANLPAGNDGDYLQTKNILGVPTIAWDVPSFGPEVITPGDPDQVFVTDSLGIAANWSDNLSLPGNLIVTGSSDLKDNVRCEQDATVDGDFSVTGLSSLNNTDMTGTINLTGDLQMSGISGAVGTVLTKTGVNSQAWVAPTTYSQVRCIRYATYFAAQDLNAGAGPTALTFDNVNIISNYAASSTGAVTGITQPSTTQFRSNFTGQYDIQITGFIDSTSTGPTSSVVTLSVEVGGVELARQCVVVNDLSFVGTFPSIVITNGTNVRILARRITGTGSFNTFAPLSVAPNFPSTISFTLVNVV